MIRLCEGIYYDDKDIYYNKDKFDRGEVNLCFIVGHSGSGKSTMALELLEKDSTLHICEMDKFYYLIWNKINFTKEEQGILFETFMQYDGKRLSQISPSIDMHNPYPFWIDCLSTFFGFAMDFADCHKDQRFVIEGVQPLEFNPANFRDYAVFIKGSSLINSKMRQAKRDRARDIFVGHTPSESYLEYLYDGWHCFERDEAKLKRFRDYFSPLVTHRCIV